MQRQFLILKHRYLINYCFVRLAWCALWRLWLLIFCTNALLLTSTLYQDCSLTLRCLGKQRFLLGNVPRPRGLNFTDIIIQKAWFSIFWLFNSFLRQQNLRRASSGLWRKVWNHSGSTCYFGNLLRWFGVSWIWFGFYEVGSRGGRFCRRLELTSTLLDERRCRGLKRPCLLFWVTSISGYIWSSSCVRLSFSFFLVRF